MIEPSSGGDTAMSTAFAAAGYQTLRERLDRMIRAAIEDSSGNTPAAVAELSRKLLAAETALVWEFFRDDRNFRLWREVEATLQQMRQERGLDAPTQPQQRQKHEGQHQGSASDAAGSLPPSVAGSGQQIGAQQQGQPGHATPGPRPATTLLMIAQDSLLGGFMVGGMPVGKCSVGVAKSWARARTREGRFVFLLCEGLTDDMIIGEKKTEEDALQAERLARESING